MRKRYWRNENKEDGKMSEQQKARAQKILDALKELGYLRIEYDCGHRVTVSINAGDAQLSTQKATAMAVVKLRDIIFQAIVKSEEQPQKSWSERLFEIDRKIKIMNLDYNPDCDSFDERVWGREMNRLIDERKKLLEESENQ